MPKKVLSFLSLVIVSGVAVASRAPDCYDMGGTSQTCSGGYGERNEFFALLINTVFILLFAVLGYAFVKSKAVRSAVTSYAMLVGGMVLGTLLIDRFVGREFAIFLLGALVWYLMATDPANVKKQEEVQNKTEAPPTQQEIKTTLKQEKEKNSLLIGDDKSNPNLEFDFHWGVPADEWFEQRYPRVDSQRDLLARKAEEKNSAKHGIDLMGINLKLPWLIGYEEGRYAALKITERTKKQSMKKSDREFNFAYEEVKRIFYDGYDAGYEAWKRDSLHPDI